VAVGPTLAAAALSALASIAVVRRSSLRDALAGGSRSVAAGGSRACTALVAAEVALALVLVAGAGLLLRSFTALRAAPLGFEPRQLVAFDCDASEKRHPDLDEARLYVEELLARVRALPGVEAAAAVTLRPLWGTVGMDWPFTVEGQSPKDAERNPLVNFETVTPGYFQAAGIPLARGRDFDAFDRSGRPGVAIVSDALARRYWPGQDPIGKRLKIPLPPTEYNGAWLTVVGVAGDARYRELQATRLDLYLPARQSDHRPHHVVVRATGDLGPLESSILRTLRGLDPGRPAPRIVSMTSVVHDALAGPRFAARVLSAFALVGLLLAALGLYGLVAYSVGRRSREIGLRVTLGARPQDVARLVLREGLAPAAVGVVLGLAGALAAARLGAKLLYGVAPTDAVTLAAAAALLLAVAALAAGLPAARALRVEPSVALREP
jgi:predicted permease